MTFSHLQGHSYCKYFKCDFSYSCATVVKISTDSTSCGSGVCCKTVANQALRICLRAYLTSPVSSLQVLAYELPLNFV